MKLLTAILILIVTGVASAQTAQKIVYWSGDPQCGYKSEAIKPTDSLSCTLVDTARGKVSSLNYNGVNLTVAFLEDGKYLILGAKITNLTEAPVSFDSDLWGA